MGRRVRMAGLGLLIAVGGLIALVVLILPATGAMRSYRAPSESMLPAIELGDRFLVQQVGYEPKVGDIVVARAPAGALDDRCGGEELTSTMCMKPTPELS